MSVFRRGVGGQRFLLSLRFFGGRRSSPLLLILSPALVGFSFFSLVASFLERQHTHSLPHGMRGTDSFSGGFLVVCFLIMDLRVFVHVTCWFCGLERVLRCGVSWLSYSYTLSSRFWRW